MEHQKIILHQSSPSNSVTSAIDLPSPSPSPSLIIEADHSAIARRRSWGNNKLRESPKADNSSPHPLHLDLDSNMSSRGGGSAGQEPFLSTHEHTIPHYADQVYSEGTSRVSLIHGHFEHEAQDDNHREDDQAHLTSNMSRTGTDSLLLEQDTSSSLPTTPEYSINDPEIEGGATPRTRRRTLRYNVATSPLEKAETAIKSVSNNLRRMSLRVVNLANTGLEGQLRLGDGDEDDKRLVEEDEEDEGPPQPDLSKVFPIRGRALGFLGPESKIRLTLFNFLVHPCVSYSCSPPTPPPQLT